MSYSRGVITAKCVVENFPETFSLGMEERRREPSLIKALQRITESRDGTTKSRDAATRSQLLSGDWLAFCRAEASPLADVRWPRK